MNRRKTVAKHQISPPKPDFKKTVIAWEMGRKISLGMFPHYFKLQANLIKTLGVSFQSLQIQTLKILRL